MKFGLFRKNGFNLGNMNLETRVAVLEEKINMLQALVMLNLGVVTAILATLLAKVL